MKTEIKKEIKTYDFEFTSSYSETTSVEALNFKEAFAKFESLEGGYGELDIQEAVNVTDTDNPIVVVKHITAETLQYEIDAEEYDENKLNEEWEEKRQ